MVPKIRTCPLALPVRRQPKANLRFDPTWDNSSGMFRIASDWPSRMPVSAVNEVKGFVAGSGLTSRPDPGASRFTARGARDRNDADGSAR